MPNGADKNWVRAQAAINGFYLRFGKWPTKLLMPRPIFRNFTEDLFDRESMAKIETKLILVEADVPVVAVDDDGNQYSYGKEGFPEGELEVDAERWLGVTPDCKDEPSW